MKRLLTGLRVGLTSLVLSSCTPSGDLASTTTCETATAQATYTWQVAVNRDRDRASDLRQEQFAQTHLSTVNGEQPPGAVTGPDDNRVWWPALPPRPTADEIDARLKSLERSEPPALQRRVDYRLRCAAGELTTDAQTYRRAARTFSDGRALSVSYSLGRVLKADFESQPVSAAPSARPATRPASVAAQTLHVNLATGGGSATGTLDAPFKTITQALAQAGPGTTIQLASGTYSADTGEVFPLQLKAGVTVRGDEVFRGKGFVITGGGKFLSPTWAGQTVTVVAVEGSRLVGLTLSNPQTRGSAVWIEAGAPSLERNTFAGSNREGVFVSGQATPKLRFNTFEKNNGNGVSLTRDSGGLLEGNLIRSTGFGVAIGDRARPELVNNQILNNLDGLVISGDARPILRRNTIANNQRDGIVVINSAQPELQQNRLGQNGQYDLHNNTAAALRVSGTELSGLKLQGPLR